MKLLSEVEAKRWCTPLGVEVQGSSVGYAAGQSLRLRLPVPTQTRDLLTFVYVLLMSAISTDDELDFQGALLWLTDWDIWSPTTERVGLHLLIGARGSEPNSVDVRSAPAHLLATHEIAQAQSLLLLPLLFQWDALYVPPTGAFVCSASHEGAVELHVRDVATLARLRARFARSGYEGDEIRDV